MKRFWVALGLIVYSGSLLFQPISSVVHAEDIVVSYVILNDEQEILDTSLSSGSYVTLPQVGNQIIDRDNVVLSPWFKNASLTIPFYAEDESVTQSLTLYSEWRYLNDSIQKASLSLSRPGTSFTTGSVTLSLPLYEPLAQGVTYQWQQRLVNAPAWIDIENANTFDYVPNRNGTYEFRVKYYVQQSIGESATEVRKESQSITITLSGALDWQLIYYPLGLIILISVVLWVNRKQPIDYYIEGKLVNRRYMKVYEDISIQPIMEKDGYSFSGWFKDKELTSAFEGMRMPRKKVILYGAYRKKV